jgi:hypothetical protein
MKSTLGQIQESNALIKPLPSDKKIKLGRLEMSKARFLEVPISYTAN